MHDHPEGVHPPGGLPSREPGSGFDPGMLNKLPYTTFCAGGPRPDFDRITGHERHVSAHNVERRAAGQMAEQLAAKHGTKIEDEWNYPDLQAAWNRDHNRCATVDPYTARAEREGISRADAKLRTYWEMIKGRRADDKPTNEITARLALALLVLDTNSTPSHILGAALGFNQVHGSESEKEGAHRATAAILYRPGP